MNFLIRIYGYPHEFLHVVALWLIGRRAVQFTQTHVDIPDDLLTGQYVFVAGLPALVFWGAAGTCLHAIFNAANLLQAVLWFLTASFFALGGLGTIGDMALIVRRLTEGKLPPDDEG